MQECLITKLKTSVNDDTLDRFNHYKIELLPNSKLNEFTIINNDYNFNVISTPNVVVKNTTTNTIINNDTSLIGRVNMSVQNNSDKIETIYINKANTIYTIIIVDSTFSVTNYLNQGLNNKIYWVNIKNSSTIFDTKYIKENTALQVFCIYGPEATGNLLDFSNKLSLTQFDIFNTKIEGDLVDLVKAYRNNGRTEGTITIGYVSFQQPLTFNGNHFSINGSNGRYNGQLIWTENTITFLDWSIEE